jgi:hypothetical protein
VRCVDLTDDELWRAIAENTNAISDLVQQQLELDEKFGEADPASRAILISSHLETINRHQREYRDYAAELRRRYPIAEAGRQRIVGESAKRILSKASVEEIFGSAN